MNEEKLMTIAQTLVVVEQSGQCPVWQNFSLGLFLFVFFAVEENIQDLKKGLQKVQHVQGVSFHLQYPLKSGTMTLFS